MPITFRSVVNAVRASVSVLQKFRSGPAGAPRPQARKTPGQTPSVRRASPGGYPGDFHGTSAIRYAPQPDGAPDPGEVVWAWVPYEEDHSQGKDRPVLLIGTNGRHLLGLMLTSRDHDPDGSTSGEYVDIGAGSWDRQGRPSEANLGRILQLHPDSIRREGAVLDRKRFDLVAAGLRRRHGWK